MWLETILELFAHQNAEMADVKRLEEAPVILTRVTVHHAAHRPTNDDSTYR